MKKEPATVREKIIAKAWKDPAFKKRLLSNPKAVIDEMGGDLPDNVKVKVVEDAADTFTFVLPPSPTKGRELNEKDLEKVAGAGSWGCLFCNTL